MNKFFSLLPLLLSVTCGLSAESFTQLKPTITKDARSWTENNASTLNTDELSVFGAYFLLTSNLSRENSEENIEQLISCFRSIQENPKMTSVFQQYETNVMEQLEGYDNYLQNKFERTILRSAQEELTQEQKDSIITNFKEKAQQKISELFAYINAIYYNILNSYNNPETQTSTDAATTA